MLIFSLNYKFYKFYNNINSTIPLLCVQFQRNIINLIISSSSFAEIKKWIGGDNLIISFNCFACLPKHQINFFSILIITRDILNSNFKFHYITHFLVYFILLFYDNHMLSIIYFAKLTFPMYHISQNITMSPDLEIGI